MTRADGPAPETASVLGVELWGFEPQTPSMRTRCATRLRHSPPAPQGRSKANRSPLPPANRIRPYAEYEAPRPPASYARPRNPPPRRYDTDPRWPRPADRTGRGRAPWPPAAPPPSVPPAAAAPPAGPPPAAPARGGPRPAGPRPRPPRGPRSCAAAAPPAPGCAGGSDRAPSSDAGHREPDPEPRADREYADQLDDVEQEQRGEHPAPADHRGGVPAHRYAARRPPRSHQPQGPPRRRRVTRTSGYRNRHPAGEVDRSASGHGSEPTAARKHPCRRLRPLRGEALGGVVPAHESRCESEQPGRGEDGEEHRGRHPHPSRQPRRPTNASVHEGANGCRKSQSSSRLRAGAAEIGAARRAGQCRNDHFALVRSLRQRASRPPSPATSSLVIA